MSCACPRPIQSLNVARYGDMCLKCGKRILGDWVADDDTMGEFYDRLAEAMNLDLDLDPGHPYEFFRRQGMNRFLFGQQRWGYRYLERDNAIDGTEEASDGANYSAYEEMKDRREGLAPSVHLMMAAMHFAKAHEELLRHKAMRRGTPSYRVDE